MKKQLPIILFGEVDNKAHMALALLQHFGKTRLVATRDVATVSHYLEVMSKDVAYPDVLVVTDLSVKKVGPNIINIEDVALPIGPLTGRKYGWHDGNEWHGADSADQLRDAVSKTATTLWTPQGTTYNFPLVLGHHLSCNGKCEDKCWW